jgi:hypothetical protein
MVMGLPGGVVGSVVVERAEELAVGEVGPAPGRPGLLGVVGFAPGGWDGAAVGGALAVADGHRLALGRGEQPGGAAEVEDLTLPAEDDGDDPGLAGEPAGLLGGDPVPGRGSGDADPGEQGVEVQGDHHRRRSAAVDREPGVGDPGVQVGRPVTSGLERQPGCGACPGVLGHQPLVLGLVGDLRGEVLEDPAAEVAQLAGAELLGLLDEVHLGLDHQVVTEVGRQGFQGLDDHSRLRQVHVTRTQRLGGPGPPRPEGRSQRRVPAYRPVRLPRLVRQPRRGRPVTGLLGESSEAARTRSRSASARLITREIRSRSSCFSSTVRNSGLIAAISSNTPSSRSRGAASTCWT